MLQYEIKMPKLGESVQEALITKWFVAVGERVEEDQILFEVATDKVDSEIPSPVEGKVIEIRFPENATAAVGEVLLIIDLSDENNTPSNPTEVEVQKLHEQYSSINNPVNVPNSASKSERFLSPLVKTMAKKENISTEILNSIEGSGANGRVRKQDIISYLDKRSNSLTTSVATKNHIQKDIENTQHNVTPMLSSNDEIVEMSRMRKIIAQHMVDSVLAAPHVTSFVEADMENVVRWRNRIKDDFKKRENVNLTFMPIFIEAVTKALRDFPWVNASIQGDSIIKRNDINIGIAVSTQKGDLIVPVIKNADRKNLIGLAHELSDLANRGRINKLSPDEIQGGTFTITNFGSFGIIMETSIINQPQSAILATGTIEKKPSVLETEYGDVVVIRHKMFLSLSYDHRIIDGALGGSFLKQIAKNLENFDTSTAI